MIQIASRTSTSNNLAVITAVARRAIATAAAAGQQGKKTRLQDTLRIGSIPADGIGKEVVPAAQLVVEAVGVPVKWISLDAGFEYFQRHGVALPQSTVDTLINSCDGALFGAVSSPSHRVEGYSSPIVALRKKLDLFANIRPVISSPHVPRSLPGINCVIVRENTECLYVKEEQLTTTASGHKVATATRRISQEASARIAKVAFDIAVQRAREFKRPGKVTIVHKANVLPITDGLFRETVLAVSKESAYKDIIVEEQLVDSCVYRTFIDPQSFDVLVAPNMYGDIISDGAAAVVGGLGLVPSANSGNNFVVAEPVHGSAPDIAGLNIANPIATIRAAGLMLQQLGHDKAARAIEAGIQESLRRGQTTKDLGGSESTHSAAEKIASHAVAALARG
ncbi:isopropylmalate dehydrogenase [Capsaspora owczarzaki ATCC 30864]|uniref:Isopropylmalate dehydrogenase n=1 Tax=Capsaspora owczarzaki (strain ATCC 30864) TaxID=595528 RepID=A0A0D2UF88_CAPO3|nr:isopropylmalate dehydrogenase [Capsaspora owczarzaki ATCC 30864]KJE93771.1 isopropylmalate dehydrogenase [Capsaspora owczarzaki ATCC 30864]|eukprot:XP_004347265.1 isopropylmalate dehydrogenase [Capsaspora owczarzaki ATCC 30864]